MSQEHLGFGVFTTFVVRPFSGSSHSVRTTIDGKTRWGILHLEKHLLRLCHDAQVLGLCGESKDDLLVFFDNAIGKLLATLDVIPPQVGGVALRCRLKITTDGLSIDSSPYHRPWPEEAEIAALFVTGERSLPQIKSLSCVLSQCARNQAHAMGAQEAILLGEDGSVREGAWSNLFWFNRQGQLYTTTKKILPGVTREHLVREFNAIPCSISLAELLEVADELLISQSTTGVTPISKLLLGGRTITKPTLRASDLRAQFDASQATFAFPVDELRPSRHWLGERLTDQILAQQSGRSKNGTRNTDDAASKDNWHSKSHA